MATSRSLLLSVVLSGCVFSAATLPLVFMGSRSITIEVEEKPLLTGRIQDLASPYLGLVAGLSAGVGLIALSLSEWRNTAQKLNQARDRVSALEYQLQQQENQVERLKFSESRLHSQGLNFFLETADSPASTFSPVHPNPGHSAAPQSSVSHSTIAHPTSSLNPATAQIEELTTALKLLTKQVEQLKNPEAKEAIGHAMNASVNASVRA